VEAADREYLAEVAGDATAGLDCLRRREDCYHVCGSASIFTVGGGLSPRRGRLLGYHQAASHETRQAVTFASMVFE
ncbi:MAG: hypothetical protein LBU79_03710, partial [Planctomycetota bacterium]|jgi:hypothetical protein|nr:hypothetical protein [Planctomycetota bacterium]